MAIRSSFTTPLRYEVIPGNKRRLTEAFIYMMGWIGSGVPFPVEKGFEFDGGSWPKGLHWYMHPFDDRIIKGAAVHDKAYRQGLSRLMADVLLFEAMGVAGAPLHDRLIVFAGVRLCGWHAYNKYRRSDVRQERDAEAAVTVIQEAAQASAADGG